MRTIGQIDADITSLRKVLIRQRPIRDTTSAAHWQRAWDAEPQLAARHSALFLERGQAQLIRDEKALAITMKSPKMPRTKKCMTCQGTGRVNA